MHKVSNDAKNRIALIMVIMWFWLITYSGVIWAATALSDDDIVEKASNNTYREKEHSLITFEDKKIRIRAIGEGISIRLL